MDPNQAPPDTLFYAPGVAGKKGPFYMALRGIRSARRTSASMRNLTPEQRNDRIQVWQGTVTWTKIDLQTGSPIWGPDGSLIQEPAP